MGRPREEAARPARGTVTTTRATQAAGVSAGGRGGVPPLPGSSWCGVLPSPAARPGTARAPASRPSYRACRGSRAAVGVTARQRLRVAGAKSRPQRPWLSLQIPGRRCLPTPSPGGPGPAYLPAREPARASAAESGLCGCSPSPLGRPGARRHVLSAGISAQRIHSGCAEN